jgi:hypothetical protein
MFRSQTANEANRNWFCSLMGFDSIALVQYGQLLDTYECDNFLCTTVPVPVCGSEKTGTGTGSYSRTNILVATN